jgi:hypothetical protein
LLSQGAAEFKYLQTGDALPGYLDESMQQQAAGLDAERRSLLKELLDLDVRDSLAQFAAVNPLELTLGFLPEDRRARVIALQEEYAREQSALFTGANENVDVGAALEQLRADHQRRLGELMTPEELQRYELTISPLAMALRSELAGFEPTEEEFRQIYEARKAQEAEVEATRVFLGAQIQAREAQEAAEREAQAELAAVQDALLEQLGPERYAQLQRADDPDYQLLMRVSRTGEMPPAAANRLYEYDLVARVEAEKVRANQQFTLEEREIALNAIRAETERTIRETMGDTALRAYREWNEQQAIQRELAVEGR